MAACFSQVLLQGVVVGCFEKLTIDHVQHFGVALIIAARVARAVLREVASIIAPATVIQEISAGTLMMSANRSLFKEGRAIQRV